MIEDTRSPLVEGPGVPGEDFKAPLTTTNEKSNVFKLSWAAVMLTSGTLTTLLSKIQFETESTGSASCNAGDDDDYHCKFTKPWFTVLEMKLAMALCLNLYYLLGVGKEASIPDPDWPTIKRVWLPALLDLLNTVLSNIGLVWVSSSIYQMTRGSVVVFSAIFSVKWLGRTLRTFHYHSIMFVLVAVILVGLAGTEEKPPTDDDCADGDDAGGDDGGTASGGEVLLGLGCIMASQVLAAVQFIVEEKLMDKMTPTVLVGYEGLWGLGYFVLLIPVLSLTPRSDAAISAVWHEDFGDTFVQLSNSTTLCFYCVFYMVAILAYNVSANTVTQCLSAVVRSILEACRTMGVWLVSLLIFYAAGTSCSTKAFGERWTAWSFLELAGFGVLLLGTFAYKALVKLPWVPESEYIKAIEDSENKDNQTDSHSQDKDVYSLLEGT